MAQFDVYVTMDMRREELGYRMGLEELYDDPEVAVTFLPERSYDTLRSEDLAGADAVISVEDTIDESTLAGLDRLKIVARNGAGFDNLDVDACTKHGIVAVHAPRGPTASVAQGTLGLILTCAHNIHTYSRDIYEHGFREGRFANMGFELYDKTIGIVGVGLIGRKLLELLRPFEMDVKAYDPYLPREEADELGIELVGLEELLETADIVSLHVPLTDETRGMLDEEEFRTMKDSAYLINTTRGGIYADETLAKAVREGWIAGAAVDVFEDEPHIEGNPLLSVDNCVLTPHIIGVTIDSMTRIGNIVTDSILRVKNGEVPRNILNPAVYDEPVPDERLSPSFRSS